MLPRAHRLTRADDYRRVIRRGRRSVSASVICYRLDDVSDRALFGVVVSKQVGGAVTRNRVRRRLQAICADVARDARPDQLVVLRALPGSSTASWDTLRTEVADVLGRAVQTA